MAYKNIVRTLTSNFLEDFPNSNTFKLSDKGKGANAEAVSENALALTGAIPAYLPMEISMVGKSGERNSFILLINPETWNHGKTTSYQPAYTRNGFVVQMWGPNQDTISSTGRSAGFITPESGLEYLREESSFAYLNLLALIAAYRNNGYQYEDFTGINQSTRVVKYVHNVSIMYDNNVYMGHFVNFTIDQLESTPYLFNYNFEFIVSGLSGDDSQTRGHYITTSPSEISLSSGTAKDPSTNVLASDTFVKNTPTIMKHTDARDITIRLWEQKTKLKWSDAINMNYTDGSVERNQKLRGLIMSKKWDPATKTFVSTTTVQNSSTRVAGI